MQRIFSPLRRKLLVFGLAVFVVLLSGASLALAQTSVLTIERNAALSAGGTQATVKGTLQCTVGEQFQLQVRVSQGDGQHEDFAFGFTNGVCNGGLQAWQVTADSGSTLHTGRAVARADNFTFGVGFSNTVVDRTIRLG